MLFRFRTSTGLQLICLIWLLGSFAVRAAEYDPPDPTDPGVAPQFDKLLLVLEGFDGPALSNDLKRSGASLPERHRVVVEELRHFAATSQEPLIEALKRLEAGGTVRKVLPFHVANIIAVECLRDSVGLLERLPGVQRIEPDARLRLIAPVENRVTNDREGMDPLDETTEDIRLIRADRAWELGFSGSTVLVANMDSGVESDHPALANQWRGNHGEPFGECWLDLFPPLTATPQGFNSHGSQTMGIICGVEPGDTIGVAWGAQYIAAQLDFNAMALVSTALEAFEWMLDPDGNPATFDDVPRVLSNSWGLDGADPCNTVFYAAIDNAEAAGTAIVWAAGNDGPSPGSLYNPANRAATATNAFAVGGYDRLTGDIYAASSRGPTICTGEPDLMIKPEVIAPARNVRSAGLNGTYVLGTGTSFAAPHVAGTMALMLDANLDLDPDSLKELIMLTAVDGGTDGDDNSYGHGLLDAYFATFAAMTGIGWVEGYILDEFGTPIESEIYLPEHPHTFASDASGHFRFPIPAWLPVQIRVVVPSYEIFTGWVITQPQMTEFYDIDLVPGSDGTLTGTVIDCQGLPGAGALVEILNTVIAPQFADANGRFVFSLPAGFYDVRGSTPECGQTTVPGVQIVTGGVTDIEIVLPLNPNFVCSPEGGGGYRICDYHDPDGPQFDWTELAPEEGGRGFALNFYDDDAQEIILPFPVQFYGQEYRTVWVNSNGSISFGAGIDDYFNVSIPTNLAPAVFAYWDDLDDMIGGEIGGIFANYEPRIGAFVVEWYQVPRYRPPPDYPNHGTATLQVIIHDPEVRPTSSGNAVIEVMYGDIDSSNSCTIGLEGDHGPDYVRYLYNGGYEQHASPMENGLALRMADDFGGDSPGQLLVQTPVIELDVAPGETVDTSLTLMNTGAGAVSYRILTPEETPISGAGKQPASLFGWTPQPLYVKGEPVEPVKGDGAPPSRPMRPSPLDSGGVDVNGYAWISSDDPGGPGYDYLNISGLGTNVGITQDDESSEPIDLPWEFEFYGRKFRKLAVNSNGFLSFYSLCDCWLNRQLAYTPFTDPYYVIAPFWVDLDPREGGGIYTFHDTEADRFVVQWDDIERINISGSASTFQIILYRDGVIEFIYEDMTNSTSAATVGIKGGSLSEIRQLSYGTTFVHDNLLVRIHRPEIPEAECRLLDHSCGVIPAGGSLDVPIRFANNALLAGSASWSFLIESTDEQAASQTVNMYLISPGDIDARLVILPEGEDMVLRWRSYPTTNYCIYSGSPNDTVMTTFEGMTADTFFTIPDPLPVSRIYEVRLCTAAAGESGDIGP